MTINERGLELIKSFEGCSLKAYKDVVGILTIGYGHTGRDVYEGKVIDQEEAEELLKDDLVRFESGVTDVVKSDINENQFSALVCFAFNVGLHALYKSHLLQYVNSGDFNAASEQFMRWNKAGGVEVPGLTHRRLAEKTLFES